MYHSLYMQKSCSEPTPNGPHIGWRGVTSVQGGILADYDQIDTHVLKWNPAKFGYPKSLHIRATRDWDIPSTTFWCYISAGGQVRSFLVSKLRFDAIYPPVAILASRQFRAAYWLITTKTLVKLDGTYPDSLVHIRATRDWDVPSKLRFDAIYPSVAILVSRQFRAAYWLISFSFLKDWEIMYHSLYM